MGMGTSAADLPADMAWPTGSDNAPAAAINLTILLCSRQSFASRTAQVFHPAVADKSF